jgi:DNA-binding NarL/FixJ family response regulator
MPHAPQPDLDVARVRCLLVDDQPAVLEGLRRCVEAQGCVDVCGQVADGVEAVRAILEESPDVVLMGLRLPRLDGVQVAEQVRSAGSTSKLVLLSTRTDRDIIERAFAAGCDAYVSRNSQLEVLATAVDTVLAGRRYIDPGLAAALLDECRDALSGRERQVLCEMGAGLHNKQIARQLDVSEDTIKAHVGSVMRKLGATSRTHAVATALRSSLID